MFSERVVETGQGGMGSGVKNDQFSKSREILVFFGLGGLPKNGFPCFPQWFDVFGLGQKTLEFMCFLNVSWIRGSRPHAESKTETFPKAGKF